MKIKTTEVKDSENAIKKILNSHFSRDNIKENTSIYKIKLNWEILCDLYEMPKKKPTYGYEDREYPNSVAYYIMKLGYSLVVEEKYVDYPKWKNVMRSKLSFLKDYLYSHCDDKDIDYIIDCVWNSEIYGRSISDLAYLKNSLIKRFLLHRFTIKISYYTILLVEVLLLLFVSIDYIFCVSFFITLKSVYIYRYNNDDKKVINEAVYPILLIVFNYICGFLFISNGYRCFLNESWETMKCGLSSVSIIHGCNAILLLTAIILDINKYNQMSWKRTKKDCKCF